MKTTAPLYNVPKLEPALDIKPKNRLSNGKVLGAVVDTVPVYASGGRATTEATTFL
ncbi:MAG: hypothetical protein JSV66_02750 [Trueperaceae bacterium]|nr:MAG: hypothetical protein JSV66_02750 [Trueperaceae bacterium]